MRQDQQAIDDREERIPVVVGNAILAEQQRGRLPGHQVDRDLVVELAQLLLRTRQIVEDLEAVDDDDRRLDLLHVLHDELGGGLEPLGSQHHAEVDELDAGLELLGVEERELLEVAQGLGGRLGKRAEDQDAIGGRRIVKDDLLAQDRLPRARRATHDRHRALGQTAVEDRVQVGTPVAMRGISITFAMILCLRCRPSRARQIDGQASPQRELHREARP